MIIVHLTEQEAQALMTCLDHAVKGSGLVIAETAVVLAKKVQEASKAAKTRPTSNGHAANPYEEARPS